MAENGGKGSEALGIKVLSIVWICSRVGIVSLVGSNSSYVSRYSASRVSLFLLRSMVAMYVLSAHKNSQSLFVSLSTAMMSKPVAIGSRVPL